VPHQGQSTHESAPLLKGHLLTPALKEIRQTRAKHLLQWHAKNGHENIFFMDEKFFTIEEQYNNQNNKIYAQMSLEVHSEGAGLPSFFLHHGLVEASQQGVAHFICAKRGETGVRVHQEDVLQGDVKQLNMTLFSSQEWVFQQDSVPAQKPRRLTTQEWLRRNVPTFISTEDWSLGSPDLNPGTINCGLFWRTWLAKSVTTTWTA